MWLSNCSFLKWTKEGILFTPDSYTHLNYDLNLKFFCTTEVAFSEVGNPSMENPNGATVKVEILGQEFLKQPIVV